MVSWFKNGNSTTSLGSFFQCLNTFTEVFPNSTRINIYTYFFAQSSKVNDTILMSPLLPTGAVTDMKLPPSHGGQSDILSENRAKLDLFLHIMCFNSVKHVSLSILEYPPGRYENRQ